MSHFHALVGITAEPGQARVWSGPLALRPFTLGPLAQAIAFYHFWKPRMMAGTPLSVNDNHRSAMPASERWLGANLRAANCR